jgi:LysM repeat protein
LPEPASDLLDRKAESRKLIGLLRASPLVELSGEPGFGKTALLRHLAQHVFAQSFADGVVYLTGRGRNQGDLLAALFAAFHERAPGFRPSELQAAQALHNRQALILLDDMASDEAAVAALLDAAPGCSFVLASTDRQLWGENRAVPLLGLQNAVAVTLLEREWGQPVTDETRRAALLLCYFLQGQPRRLRQAAALLREERTGLDGLQAQARAGDPGAAIVSQLLETASAPEQQALRALAAAQGAPVSPAALGAASGIDSIRTVLDHLERRGLAVAEGAAYRLPGEAAEAIARLGWDVEAEAEQLGDYVLRAAEERGWGPEAWQAQAELVVNLVQGAAARKAWPKAWRLARAVETPLALAQAWGPWGQVLQLALQATRQMGEAGGAAWALHQAGTRALCLGDAAGAREMLGQALHLRHEQGDRVGTALTKHNLGLVQASEPSLRRPLAQPQPQPAPPAARPAARQRAPKLAWPLTIAALVSVAIMAAFGFAGWRWLQAKGAATPVLAGALMATATPTQTATAMLTEALTLAPTHTATAVPSATQTPAATATSEPTGTAAPTETAPPTSTATVTSAATATAVEPTEPVPTQAGMTAMPSEPAPACQVRTDWPIYVVQPGNTLWSVARAVGSTVDSLAQANCLASTFLYSGQLLRVPRLPAAPTQPATSAPSQTPEDTATAVPTEAPPDTPTEAPTEPPTAAPTETATEAPTATAVPSDTPAPTAAPTETATAAPSSTPEVIEVPTEAPSNTPEPTPTAP